VSVNIKAINSRRVTITGNVNKPAAYSLAQPMTVVELISIAGGLQEYAKGKKIMILRPNKGGSSQTPIPFNYEDVMKGKNLKQNIQLQPGDQVIVP
jgi:polysaccharide export outer membrane protein